MAKLIVVCGATGQLGGSVARRMLNEGWSVRAITRNTNGEAAKALAAKGAELATADYDDEASLTKAFEVNLANPLMATISPRSSLSPGRSRHLRRNKLLGIYHLPRPRRRRREGVQPNTHHRLRSQQDG